MNSFSLSERADLRRELLPILFSRIEWFSRAPVGGIPGSLALMAFAPLLARVWRICWFEIADNIDVKQDYDSDDDDYTTAMGGVAKPSSSANGIGMSTGGANGANGDGDDPLLHVVAQKMVQENPSIPSTLVGITVLLASVEEMGKQLPRLWPAVQRKTAVAFRDRCLLSIFNLGLQTLQRLLVSAPMSEPERTQQRNLVTNTLTLLQQVFSFDFVGTSPDESNDDLGIIHIPASWSKVFEDPTTLRTLTEFYNITTGNEQRKSLELLSSLVSVRSNLFGNSSGQITFLVNFFEFLGTTITQRKGLNDLDNIHILCRLLVRLKCNFTLSQFVSVPTWKMLIELVSQFHIEIMNSDDCNPNVLFYIMSWWQRLASSIHYLSPTADPTHLPELMPELVRCFLVSQLKREEDFPEDDNSLLINKQLPLIISAIPGLLEVSGRTEVITMIIEMFNSFGATFSSFQGGTLELGILERQLALLVHLVSMLAIERGSAMSTPNSLSSSKYLSDGIEGSIMDENAAAEQMETLEIEMISCVFELLQLHDSRFTAQGPAPGSYQLEFALTSFLRQFSSCYFALEEVEKRKLQKVLEERHGMVSKENVLNMILSKIAFNLDKWSQDKWPKDQWPNGTDVTKETLQLFLALVIGTHSSRIVAKSELVSQLLANHTGLDWGSNERYRREFYRVLGRIAFKDSDIGELYKFLTPFETKLIELRNELQNENSTQLYEMAPTLSQTLCDLRGALMACHSPTGYETFFEWFYPAGYYESVCYMAIQRYAGYNWKVVWNVLRFVEELVTNTHKRIQFPGTSPDGHRLFRDTAHLLISVAEKILQIPTGETRNLNAGVSSMGFSTSGGIGNGTEDSTSKDIADIRYKAISLFLRIFARLLSGASDFANIGVFAMFGDKIVSELLMAACNVIFSMDMEEAQGYTKVIDVLYIALENICMHNLADLLGQDVPTTSAVLGQVLLLLKRGLRSRVVRIICNCTQSLDKICMNHYHTTQRLRTRPDANPTVLSDAHIDIIGDIMFELLDLVLVDHDIIHWTLCRPLFVLVQLLPDVFSAIKDAIIETQPTSAIKLQEAFKALFVGVDETMRPENREKFTTNALELKNTCKSLIDFNVLYKQMHRVSDPQGGGGL